MLQEDFMKFFLLSKETEKVLLLFEYSNHVGKD